MRDGLMKESIPRPELILASPARLRPTEECVPDRLMEVTSDILRDGFWKEPILVERGSMIVMDGHHRLAFALQRGLASVPCLLVTYSHVSLTAWRNDVVVSPDEIISRGMTGKLYPPKSTRHTLLTPVDYVCNFPLAMLFESGRVSLEHFQSDSQQSLCVERTI